MCFRIGAPTDVDDDDNDDDDDDELPLRTIKTKPLWRITAVLPLPPAYSSGFRPLVLQWPVITHSENILLC